MSQADLDQLSRWRTIGARRSDEILELATRVLGSGRLGDQEWAIREQLCLAALDMGRIQLATEQLNILQRKFPASPRVTLLHALRLEASNDPAGAEEVYKDLLKLDETNISAHQRLISLSLSEPTTCIPNLLNYLDTFYSDPQAWSLLSELYSNLGHYAQSLSALGHVMVLQVWDSSAVVRAGETAYTLGDYQLALKHFLRACEMEVDPSALDSSDSKKKTRSWWGVQLATRRLLKSNNEDSAVPVEMRSTPKQLTALNQLATERLLAAGGAHLDIRRQVLSGQTAEVVR